MEHKRKTNLADLVQELQKENLQKRDIVIPASCLSMHNGQIIVANTAGSKELDKILYQTGISYTAENQRIRLECLETMDNHLAEKLGIPVRYFQKMRDGHNPLLDANVTHWLQNNNTNYLLRSFVDKENEKGIARALLSDRFKTIDNLDILLTVLSAVKESGMNIQIDADSCDLSEKRMYVRFTCPDIEIQAPELLRNYRPNGRTVDVGDGIISGFVITNSEVGHGSMTIMPRAVVLKCRNGMVRADEKFAQKHLGAKMGEYESITWSNETKEKNLELIMNQVKDCIKQFVSEDYLGKMIADTVQKGQKELEHPMDCIKQVTSSLEINEAKQDEILNYFIKSGDLSAFGVSQAITLYAGNSQNPDEQFELENAAMAVLDKIDEFDRPLAKKSVKTLEKLN